MPETTEIETQLYRRYTVQIFHDKKCSNFAGTGFLLDGTHVMTCKHVIQTGRRWVKPSGQSTAYSCTQIKNSDDLDIAIVKLKDFSEVDSSAILVEGVTEEIIKSVLSSNCKCYGYRTQTDYMLNEYVSDASDDATEIQFRGAPRTGYSGSPLLLSKYPDYGVFGMARLGREESDHSRFIRSDAIIKWLRSLNKPELVPKTVSIDEVLRRIAFGDRDWSSIVRNQWLNMWGYARNKNGEYVGRDGVTTLKDNKGRPIVVFNAETEKIVRDHGLNTGSIEYGKLYGEDPNRFGASETDEEIVQAARERMGIEDRS